MDSVSKLKEEITQLEVILTQKRKELGRLLQSSSTEQGTNSQSSPEEKIKLFRKLFRGREDVYAYRFESKKTGKSGYQPDCKNEWEDGICLKPRIKCSDCKNRKLIPVRDETIRNHLQGEIPSPYPGVNGYPFVMGIYPLLKNETTWFLAIDFDKEQWQQDCAAFRKTCTEFSIDTGLERSRSGNGGHLWIFFEHPVKASKARALGSALMTHTMDKRPEIQLDSFDRFFPNQDTLPKGGFGNLIALPLQKEARSKNHTIFLDDGFIPYPDQWAYLDQIIPMTETDIDKILEQLRQEGTTLPVSFDEYDQPWNNLQSLPPIAEGLPEKIKINLKEQIFLEHSGLPPVLRNRILRLASFSNPEFYRAQAMRLPTWNKPRILYCYEYFPEYIALPIGCLEDLSDLFHHYKIKTALEDLRCKGNLVEVSFQGELRMDQKLAGDTLLSSPNGILSATTAFGKTIVALWIIAQRKTNTLILVHRKQLMEQWAERIEQFLGIPKKEIGLFGGGKKKRTGNIDIAVMQSVSGKKGVPDWIGEYGQLIVDECHHISAFSFEQVIRKCPAKFKLGLTATLERKDGKHPIILMNLGRVLYQVKAKQQAEQRNFNHIVITKTTDFHIQTDLQELKIQEIFKSLWQDKNRNEQIVKDIQKSYEEGKEILLLSERTDHLSLLQDQLQDIIKNLFLLKGGMGKKQLRTIMENIHRVPEEENHVILATGRYFGEGIDLPFLDTLFLTFPVSWKGTIAQYAGRLHRYYYGKQEVIIYDYLDDKVPVLGKMYQRRCKGYRALGYEIN